MIYALKGDPGFDIISSLKQGEGRFGWSGCSTADLRELKLKIDTAGWESGLLPEEKDCYHGFLLELKADDYVIYINAPEWGKCTVARVTGPYFWRFEDRDFNHRFLVDIRATTRGTSQVLPVVQRSARCKNRLGSSRAQGSPTHV